MRFLLYITAFLFLGPVVGISQEYTTVELIREDRIFKKEIMIPMSDGISLATNIYQFSSNDKPLPVILQRTPYGKNSARFDTVARYFVDRGYVVAVQDLRGRYDSEGEFHKYSDDEATDGANTVEWLANQPFCDGRVGMWGTSYGAHTQADASKLDPKGLSGLILNMGGMANAWDHAVRQGGAFELGRELTWAFRQIPAESNDPIVNDLFKKENILDWYERWPFRKGLNPLSIAPNYEAYILEEATQSDYTDFWKRTGINWQEYYHQTSDVPMVHIGGWYDIFLSGTIQNYVELSRRNTTPQWLVIGPWTHSGNTRTYAGDVDFGLDAAINDFNTGYQVDWMDKMLGRSSNDHLSKKPIRLFIMGGGDGRLNQQGRLNHGGQWIEVDQWPIEGTDEVLYYFREGGTLTHDSSSSGLSHTTYQYDPKHPVPTLGGNVSARVKDGAFHQRERKDFYGSKSPYLPLKSRDDVVVFQTETLTEDMVVAGPIEILLYVSSSAVDTDFTVKLLDIYPPSEDYPEGYDMNLTDGIVRMSYRNGRTERALIEPNKVYEVKLQLFPTANLFKKGHRIRVDVSSSNFPRWDLNPNTGEPLGASRRMTTADNTIYHSEAYPSHIILPILTDRKR